MSVDAAVLASALLDTDAPDSEVRSIRGKMRDLAIKRQDLEDQLEEVQSEQKFLRRRLRHLHTERLVEKYGPELGDEDSAAESAPPDPRPCTARAPDEPLAVPVVPRGAAVGNAGGGGKRSRSPAAPTTCKACDNMDYWGDQHGSSHLRYPPCRVPSRGNPKGKGEAKAPASRKAAGGAASRTHSGSAGSQDLQGDAQRVEVAAVEKAGQDAVVT